MVMATATPGSRIPYPDRLATFQGFWNAHPATARQLAAIGHVYDRPPLEALEEGSRCLSCSAFVRREHSIRALEGPLTSSGSYQEAFGHFVFHHPSCIRLQVRIPMEPQAVIGGLHGGFRLPELRPRSARPLPSALPERERQQTTPLFSLPTELRLQIYSYILPHLDSLTSILPLNKDSSRVVILNDHDTVEHYDPTQCNLLRTCRSIHSEALDLLYRNTTYKFASTRTLYLFLRRIGSCGRNLLTSIDVYCDSREDAITFALLAACSRLRSITFRLPRPTILPPSASQWRVEGMACLLSLSGLKEVRFGDCGPPCRAWMDGSNADAAIIRRELTRPKDAIGSVRWIGGYPDL